MDSCDPSITMNTRLEGNMIAENAYGHLPASQYSSLPFYGWMVLIYVVILIMWGMLCIQYSKEIMSVHIIILVFMNGVCYGVGGVDLFQFELHREGVISLGVQFYRIGLHDLHLFAFGSHYPYIDSCSYYSCLHGVSFYITAYL